MERVAPCPQPLGTGGDSQWGQPPPTPGTSGCVWRHFCVSHQGGVEARHPTRPRTAPRAQYPAQTPNVKVLRGRNPPLKADLTGGGGIWGEVVLREREDWKTSRMHFMKQNLRAYHLCIKHHDKRQIVPSFSLNPI